MQLASISRLVRKTSNHKVRRWTNVRRKRPSSGNSWRCTQRPSAAMSFVCTMHNNGLMALIFVLGWSSISLTAWQLTTRAIIYMLPLWDRWACIVGQLWCITTFMDWRDSCRSPGIAGTCPIDMHDENKTSGIVAYYCSIYGTIVNFNGLDPVSSLESFKLINAFTTKFSQSPTKHSNLATPPICTIFSVSNLTRALVLLLLSLSNARQFALDLK